MTEFPRYKLINEDHLLGSRTYSTSATKLKITKDTYQYGLWINTDRVSDSFMLGYLVGSLCKSDCGYPLEYTVVTKSTEDGSFTAIKGWFKKESLLR